jgi:hypothetical protein
MNYEEDLTDVFDTPVQNSALQFPDAPTSIPLILPSIPEKTNSQYNIQRENAFNEYVKTLHELVVIFDRTPCPKNKTTADKLKALTSLIKNIRAIDNMPRKGGKKSKTIKRKSRKSRKTRKRY